PWDYIYNFSTELVFAEDKNKMEEQEKKIDKELTRWKRKYEDILPMLWGATDIISHADYDAIEKLITIGFPDYKF
ncbi:MAG: hypothetical protein EBW19_12475, partial [Betaproteobacteria bacterium]|nr:hypothetical protein [Betaproteobacteria bacterium]